MKYAIIDYRMRKAERDFLKSLNYELVEVPKSKAVYEEISSHMDIFCCKINNALVVEKSCYVYLKSKLKNTNMQIVEGKTTVSGKYPQDIPYNVCQIGNKIIHNFAYTDPVILQKIEEEKLQKIQISQGYSNCAIGVINENSAIVADKKIAEKLVRAGIKVLLLERIPNIKLLRQPNQYSQMNGLIGGAMASIENKMMVFGELEKIDRNHQISKFIEKQGIEVVDFKGLDVVDYGGLILA